MARTYRFKPTEKQKADKKKYPKSKSRERMKAKQEVREVAYC